jgi:osmoprotectant transport system substrate-binding protein
MYNFPTLCVTRKALICLFLVAITLTLCSCGPSKDEPGKIVIAGKRFTEQIILTHILGEYLKEKTSLDVTVKSNLGGVYILTEALKQKDIDMYVEYTGTGYLNVLKEEYSPKLTPEDVYNRTKKGYQEQFNVTWLKPLGFNNTYAMALTHDRATQLQATTVSDLTRLSPQLSLASDAEFLERPDGYRGLSEVYNLHFKKKMSINADLMYQAVYKGKADVISSYSTDPRIQQLNLTLLSDDKKFFPPYHAVPIIRKEILAANPGLEATINQLAGKITEDKIRYLNGLVNIHHRKAKEVAREFLKKEGLI